MCWSDSSNYIALDFQTNILEFTQFKITLLWIFCSLLLVYAQETCPSGKWFCPKCGEIQDGRNNARVRLLAEQMQICLYVLDVLMHDPAAKPFLAPLDPKKQGRAVPKLSS